MVLLEINAPKKSNKQETLVKLFNQLDIFTLPMSESNSQQQKFQLKILKESQLFTPKKKDSSQCTRAPSL